MRLATDGELLEAELLRRLRDSGGENFFFKSVQTQCGRIGVSARVANALNISYLGGGMV